MSKFIFPFTFIVEKIEDGKRKIFVRKSTKICLDLREMGLRLTPWYFYTLKKSYV